MAQVRLDNVNKVYGGNMRAVKDVDLQIDDQEFVVLVGPSGCGKTTTLRMIAGLEEVSGGTITIGDRVVNDVPPKDRDIAMVFQNYALYPHMTVYKNLAFALKLRKVPRKQIEERVQWAAKTLGLEELLNRRPRQLSGGQRQRVAVGRAIVRNPQVFLFDEPLSNLDAKLRVTTRAELKKLQQDLKTTTIYVTHDQEEAMTLGDRVVVMHGGSIHQTGTPLEVYRQPVNRFVAGFVGMPPMNFVDGKLEGSGSDLEFVSEALRVNLSDARFDALRGDAGREVVWGVRAEGISVTDVAGSVAVTAQGDVDVVEILGPTMDLFVSLPGAQRMVCRVPTNETKPGDSITLRIAPTDIHIFARNRQQEGSQEIAQDRPQPDTTGPSCHPLERGLARTGNSDCITRPTNGNWDSMKIESNRLRWEPFSPGHLPARLDGSEQFRQACGVPVAEGWRDFYVSGDVSPSFLALLHEVSCPQPWTFGFAVIDRISEQVVGSAGFKGPPDDEGIVEIAYGIVTAFAVRGLATEAAHELVMFAINDPRVNTIWAHTLPSQNASTQVLTKHKFTRVDSIIDPQNGPVWHWERKKATPS